jgi:hypothetical protein
MSKRRKIIIGVIGALVALGVIGALAGPPEEEASPVVTEAPLVEEDVVETAPETTEAPTTTQAPKPVDPFVLWWVEQIDIYAPLGDESRAFIAAIDAGNLYVAEEIAYGISDTYKALYMDAPETGTTLSNTTNEMFLTCSGAWLLVGIGVELGDVATLEQGTAEINRCTALTDEVTAELDRVNAELTRSTT